MTRNRNNFRRELKALHDAVLTALKQMPPSEHASSADRKKHIDTIGTLAHAAGRATAVLGRSSS